MIYKTYGKTGIEVSAVGFGGMRFDTSRSHRENADLLRYAWDQGINYFDTAPVYCNDTSEDIYGIAIREMASFREKFYVTTKVMPTAEDTYDSMRAKVEKSLRRLNTDYIDFFYVWCIRHMDQYDTAMRPGGQYEALQRLKEEGLIRHVVISTHLRGPEIRRIVQRDEFDGILLGTNILNFPFRWEGVQAAHEAGWAVVAMNPLAGGLIPRNHERLAFLAGPGETPTEAALRFLISCPQITVALNGFTTREHIDTACRVADGARPFTEDDIEQVRRQVSKNMDAVCTGCGYCKDLCPRDIIIPGYMQFYNDKLLGGKSEQEMVEHVKFHHEWGILADRTSEASECVLCGRCENACTQHLPITKRLEEIGKWELQLQEK